MALDVLELYNFHVVIPAGTLSTAPQIFSLAMPPREVVEIEILAPPGPRGEVGFKIAQAGAQVIPSGAGDFIITDNETLHWPIEGANTSGAWQIIAYNTGAFNHTLEVRFQVKLTRPLTAETETPPLDPASLGPSAVVEPSPSIPLPAGASLPPAAALPPLPGLPPAAGVPNPDLSAPTLLGLPGIPAAPVLPGAVLPPDAQGAGGTLPPSSVPPVPNPSGVGPTAGPPTPTTQPIDIVPNPIVGLDAGPPTPTTQPTNSGTRLFI